MSTKDLTPVPSPDRRHAVAFDEGFELSMMNCVYGFRLLDARGRVRHAFEEAWATMPRCAWSSDSRRFAVPIACRGEALLVVDLAAGAFSVLRLPNRQCLFGFAGGATLRVRFAPAQLRAMNSQRVFGGGKAGWPIARWRAPDPQRVDTARLPRHRLSQLTRLAAAARAAPLLDMLPVADGYFPFKGKYPASTVARINGRPMEVFHLMAFAAYGDPQARAWLAALRRKAGRKPVGKWHRVSSYIGRRARTVAPPPSA